MEPEGPFPALSVQGLRIGAPDAERGLGLGWAYGEGDFRWTDGRRPSTIRFSLESDDCLKHSCMIELDLRAYLPDGQVPQQRLIVSLNEQELATFTITTQEFATYHVAIPKGVLRRENALRLGHPDAVSPRELGKGPDARQLGVAVRSMALKSAPSS